MQFSDIPVKFQIPFANSAGGGYITTPIPEASQIGITDGRASLTDGFPPLNFLPVGSGGVPPFGQDFNGILYQATAWNRWQGAGGLPRYDMGFSSSVGGYPQGAIVASANAPSVVWLCLADNNTTDPDSTSAANWLALATLLTAPRTLWVRTDGNNSNSGSANTAGAAFQTLQGAYDATKNRYFANGQYIRLRIGLAGTYAGFVHDAWPGLIEVYGDPVTPSGVVITPPAGNLNDALASAGQSLRVNGVQMNGGSSSNYRCASTFGGFLTIINSRLVSAGGAGTYNLLAAGGGSVLIGGNIFVSGSSSIAFLASDRSTLNYGFSGNAATVTYSGTPAYSTSAVLAENLSLISVLSGSTNSGSATGVRFISRTSSLINSAGGGLNYFPGNSAGTTATGGIYV